MMDEDWLYSKWIQNWSYLTTLFLWLCVLWVLWLYWFLHWQQYFIFVILKGIVIGQTAKILPISRPFANKDNKWGGIVKVSLERRAALVLAARASLCRYGVVIKFESKSTPSRLISEVDDKIYDPILIWHCCLGDTSNWVLSLLRTSPALWQ